MSDLPEKRYSIAEASAETGVPKHVLRQWEEKFSQLKPKRNRANRRVYSSYDLQIVKRIKTYLYHRGMTIPGARVALAQELHGEGRPRTNAEVIALVDRIENEVRGMLDLLDRV